MRYLVCALVIVFAVSGLASGQQVPQPKVEGVQYCGTARRLFAEARTPSELFRWG